MKGHSTRILIVDDDAVDRRRLRRLLAKCEALIPFTVEEAKSIEEGKDLIASQSFDCVLLDYMFPDGDCLGFLFSSKDLVKGGLRTPAFVGHLIRFMSDSESDSIRTGNPVHIGHPIRSLSDSDSD